MYVEIHFSEIQHKGTLYLYFGEPMVCKHQISEGTTSINVEKLAKNLFSVENAIYVKLVFCF